MTITLDGGSALSAIARPLKIHCTKRKMDIKRFLYKMRMLTECDLACHITQSDADRPSDLVILGGRERW